MTGRRWRAAVLVGVVLTACGPAPAGDALTGELVVSAAASLTETFDELADRFTAANPEVTVTLNLGGSSALAEQIDAGAPVDVFASASTATMDLVRDAVDGPPAVFAHNRLQLAVPPGNPGAVTGLADLADPDRTVALCAEQVPCGAAARTALAAAGVTASPDTLERDVRAVLTKVRLGEVDVALVYRTDVLAARGAVAGIEFPESASAVNDYAIAVLADAPNAAAARAFVDFVGSDTGRAVLADAGFDLPPARR